MPTAFTQLDEAQEAVDEGCAQPVTVFVKADFL